MTTGGGQTTWGERFRGGFARLPPGLRRRVLHATGRYAPWEPEFDFTPPPLHPGESAGPPDFVGIGVQKAGTTWWYELISAHPEVAVRPDIHKERHYLDRFGSAPFGPTEIDRYHGWFPRGEGMTTGEWTPDYFTFPWAPELLKRAAPKAHLLLLVRDPVDRFRSGRAHQRRMGVVDDSAAMADAVERGFYNRALHTWLEHFDPEQLLILQYERCTEDPAGQLGATFEFLGLPEFHPQGLATPRQAPGEVAGGLDPEVRRRLVTLYESDVRELSARLPHLDLSLWPNFSYLAGQGEGPPGDSNSPTRRR